MEGATKTLSGGVSCSISCVSISTSSSVSAIVYCVSFFLSLARCCGLAFSPRLRSCERTRRVAPHALIGCPTQAITHSPSPSSLRHAEITHLQITSPSPSSMTALVYSLRFRNTMKKHVMLHLSLPTPCQVARSTTKTHMHSIHDP